MPQHQQAVIEGRSNKTAALLGREQAVTAEESSAAKVALPGFTHTIVTSNMFRQMHLVVLEIHTRLLRLHGTTVRMLPARMYTKTPGPVHLVIMEV